METFLSLITDKYLDLKTAASIPAADVGRPALELGCGFYTWPLLNEEVRGGNRDRESEIRSKFSKR